jgi:dTDP-glucose pyrophosphorylase
MTEYEKLSIIQLEDCDTYKILESATLIQAITLMNRVDFKTLMVMDRHDHFLGTLTDGDLRRGFISGSSTNDTISKLVNRNSIVLLPSGNLNDEASKVAKLTLGSLPCVTADQKLEKIYAVSKPKGLVKPNLAFILAGGKGARLLPLTRDIPKPLLRIGSFSILEILIKNLVLEGFVNIVISLGHLGDQIRNLIGDGSHYGASIKYVEELKPLGTAGSLTLLDKIPSHPVLVVNGDLFTDMSFSSILSSHMANKVRITIGAINKYNKSSFGVLEVQNNHLVRIDEKPTRVERIFAGISVLDPEIIQSLDSGEPLDATTLFASLLSKEERIYVHDVGGNWEDIGNIVTLNQVLSEMGQIN